MIAASVEWFHAVMAARYDGLETPVSGSGAWWTGSWSGSKWSGERYAAAGAVCVFSYAPGAISAQVGYTMECLGDWETVYGR